MKKFAAILTAVVLCLGLSSCQGITASKKLSPVEVVNTFMEAFQQGNYEGIKPYISADNPLHLFFAGIDETKGGDLSAAYQTLYEKLKTVTFTAEAVEGEETWGAVNVTLSVPDFSEELHTAMAEALVEQVENSSTAFHDMPSWISTAVQSEKTAGQETMKIYVGNRDGAEVMDTNTNRDFFEMLCGGLEPYLDASMTTCTFPEGDVWEIAAHGDEIVAMINTQKLEAGAEYSAEELEAFAPFYIEQYNGMDGVTANAKVQDGVLLTAFGVDMANAITTALDNMGVISDRITSGSMGWLSLDSTIKGFESDGAECVTEYFKTMETEQEE